METALNLPEGFELDTEKTAPSQIESFARGAANNVPLLPQAIAAGESLTGLGNEGGYSKNLAGWNARAANAKAAHPITYGAGAVTGALAPLAIPGVGEALEAAPITGNAVLGAANAISNKDLTKDVAGTAKEAALGAGIGGATAGIMGKLFPASEVSDKLENMAAKGAVKSTGMSPKTLGNMEPGEMESLGNFIRKNNLVGIDKEKILEGAEKLQNEIGQKIGSIGESAENLGLTVDDASHLQALKPLLDNAEKYGALANREGKTLARAYKSGAEDIFNLGANPKWSDIQELKSMYGPLAFGPAGEIKNQGAADTYFTLSGMLKNIAAKAQSNPELATEYKEALQNYHQMEPVISGLRRMVGIERAGGGGHGGGHGILKVIKSLPGQSNPAINLPTAIAAGTLLHPAAGIAAALPTVLNPAIHSNVAAGMAKAAPAALQGLNQEMIDYLESKYGRKD